MSITVQHGDNSYWGLHVFLEGSGEAEEIRGAYARESADWPPLHFAIAAATPEALDPWYRLGFAQMHAYGVRESGGEYVPAPGVAIRRGGPEDIEIALRIDGLIAEAQAVSPSYSAVAAEESPDRASWEKTQRESSATRPSTPTRSMRRRCISRRPPSSRQPAAVASAWRSQRTDSCTRRTRAIPG
jgi:hypothetical protein